MDRRYSIASSKHDRNQTEWLIRRIIFLEGTPVISKLNPIKIGQTVLDIVGNDREAELPTKPHQIEQMGLQNYLANQTTGAAG